MADRCCYCGGAGRVVVVESLGDEFDTRVTYEDACPVCDGEGAEPEAEPLDLAAEMRAEWARDLNEEQECPF